MPQRLVHSSFTSGSGRSPNLPSEWLAAIATDQTLRPLCEHSGFKEWIERLRSKSEDSKPKRDDVK